MNFWRALLVVTLVLTALIGLEEVRFRIHCWDMVELRGETLEKETSTDPAWARISGLVPAFPPVTLTSESGSPKGAYLLLASSTAPKTVVAVLRTNDIGEARALHRKGSDVELEGVAFLPSMRTRQFIDDVCYGAELVAAPNLRVVESGRSPMSLASLACVLIVGFGVAGLLVRNWRNSNTEPYLLDISRPGKPWQRRRGRPAPLPDDVKVRVGLMVREVWEEAEQGQR